MNPYGVNTTERSIQAPIISLNLLYDGMPKTTGCEKCVDMNGDDAWWCCKSNSPSMYYVEFLNVWKNVQSWDNTKKTNLILRAIRNYLDNSVNKGCIFFDGGCTTYNSRPFVCRNYAVIPKLNWDKRVKSIKDRMGENFEVRAQCNLVFVVGREEITPEEEDKWFAHTKKCEQRIGVSNEVINLHDEGGGSYRTFHDHLLIELFEPDFLEMLTKIRLTNPTKKEIDTTIQQVLKQFS